jgi:hypothetical protein
MQQDDDDMLDYNFIIRWRNSIDRIIFWRKMTLTSKPKSNVNVYARPTAATGDSNQYHFTSVANTSRTTLCLKPGDLAQKLTSTQWTKIESISINIQLYLN